MTNTSREAYERRRVTIHDMFPDIRSEDIDDAIFLDYEQEKVAILTGWNRKIPFFYEWTKNKDVIRYLKEYPYRGLHVCFGKEIRFINEDGKDVSEEGLKKTVSTTLEKTDNYGGHLMDDGSIVLDPNSAHVGTHYDVNLLLGNVEKDKRPLLSTPKSVVDSLFHGSFRGPAALQILATSWGISPEENGHPSNRQFYLVEDGKVIFYSGKSQDDAQITSIHHPNYSTILYKTKLGLNIKRTIYLLPKEKNGVDAAEVQLIEIENATRKERNLTLVCTGMFGCPNPEAQMVDVVYTTLIAQNRIYLSNDHTIKAISPDYYPEFCKRDIRFATLMSDYGNADYFMSNLKDFIGNGTLENPDHAGFLTNDLSIKGPNFFALGKSFTLNRKFNAYTITGYADEKDTSGNDHIKGFEKKLDVTMKNPNTFKKASRILDDIRKDEGGYADFLQITKASDSDFKAYVNNNLPFQVRYQTFVSRSFAMTQKGYREQGFREIQDLYASLPYLLSEGKKELAKKLLREWILNVFEFGYSYHNFYYQGKEPGMCSDDSLWLVHAVYVYVKESKDVSILNERFRMAGTNRTRKLKDTILAILNYSGVISIGRHGLPLLDTADWNDCLRLDESPLSGPEKEKLFHNQEKIAKRNHLHIPESLDSDAPESVMNAFLCIIACKNAAELFHMLDEKEMEEKTLSIQERMQQNTRKHALINGYFARVLLNRENKNHITYVGSFKDGVSLDKNIDGTFYLNSFSWALLSESVNEVEISSMLNVVDKYLRCKAGYKLCSPSDLSIAGAKSSGTEHYFPGDRENQGVFKHAAMMFTLACLRQYKKVKSPSLKEKLLDDAYFMLDLVFPYNVLKDLTIMKGNARFCTQYNNSKTEENIGPMLSGTASWLTLAVFEILGIDANNMSLTMDAALRKEEDGISYKIHGNDCLLDITIGKKRNTLCKKESKTIFVDGNEVSSVSKEALKGEHTIHVVYH